MSSLRDTFLPKIMSKIWGKKRVSCQKTSSGPICRYYILILISSLRDTFLSKIWGKKRVSCQKTSSDPTCRYYILILISLLRDTFYPKFGAKMSKIWGKKRVSCQKTSLEGGMWKFLKHPNVITR